MKKKIKLAVVISWFVFVHQASMFELLSSIFDVLYVCTL